MTEPVYDGTRTPPWGGEAGGLYFRSFGPNLSGYVHDGHQHTQDHWTFLLRGKVRVKYKSKKDGMADKTAVFIAPYAFIVAKEIFHEIESLEDNTTWCCVFVQPESINETGVLYHDAVSL